jgi:hypothetical protein
MRVRKSRGNTSQWITLLVLAIGGQAVHGAEERFLDITRGGKAVATIVAPDDAAPIWDAAINLIATTTERWSGARPKVVRIGNDAPLPEGDVVLLGTPGTNSVIAALAERFEGPVARVPFGDAHGFAIESQTVGGAHRLIIAGRTSRGVYDAAVYCRDFLLDAMPVAGERGRADVFARSASVFRSPQLAVRGTYLLPLYGRAMTYTAEDWMKIIDRHAEDGMGRVCFWLSGHHPSQKYPQLYDVDATRGTRLTVDGVRRLIRHCHELGMQFYIGGGVFAWTASQYLLQGHPEAAAVKVAGLCPSHLFARQANREHFLEMFDTWPEADGFMLEVRDEHGECQCERCQVKVDEFGSKVYGRAEITWLQELAREAWKRKPNLRFCWLIGYAEHAHDVAYYDQILLMSDPRFEWLDARVGLDRKAPWRLPGPGGSPHPLAFFSRSIIHWDPFYRLPPKELLVSARRSADEGLSGYMPAFEPGFATASYYGNQVPLPVNLLPYTLTGFVYREATWEPGLTLEALKDRIHKRYFSPNAPRRFAEDMIYLQKFSLEHAEEITLFAKPRYGYSGERIERLTIEGERLRVAAIAGAKPRAVEEERLRKTLARLAMIAGDLKRMDDIEAAAQQAEPTATPKTREGLALLQRMIDDTRTLYREAVPDPKLLVEPHDSAPVSGVLGKARPLTRPASQPPSRARGEGALGLVPPSLN